MDVGKLEVCLQCPYYSSKVCDRCMFAKWNVDRFTARGAEIVKRYKSGDSKLAVKSFNNVARGASYVIGPRDR